MPTPEQYMSALERANIIRIQGAAVRRDLSAGKITLIAALEHPDAARIPVGRMLESVRRVGRQKAGVWMQVAGIGSHLKRCGELTERQRVLLGELGERHERSRQVAA